MREERRLTRRRKRAVLLRCLFPGIPTWGSALLVSQCRWSVWGCTYARLSRRRLSPAYVARRAMLRGHCHHGKFESSRVGVMFLWRVSVSRTVPRLPAANGSNAHHAMFLRRTLSMPLSSSACPGMPAVRVQCLRSPSVEKGVRGGAGACRCGAWCRRACGGACPAVRAVSGGRSGSQQKNARRMLEPEEITEW